MIQITLHKFLAFLSRRIIARYRPEIVGITGSVGKTSTKETIATVLGETFKVRQTIKNYNNEIGLPLSIFGMVSPGKSVLGWLAVISLAWRLGSDKQKEAYPEALVLEMGIDHPGDMDHLMAIVRPTRAVITFLGQAHLEFFKSLEQLHNEKLKLAQALTDDGFIIYNYDDSNLGQAVSKIQRRSISFGFDPKAQVRAEHVSVLENNKGDIGLQFKLIMEGSAIPVFIPGAIGRPPVYAALAAAAVAQSYKINAIAVAEALMKVKRPAGRLQLIAGKNDTLIIDDSYNSSPDSVFEGLAALSDIPEAKRKRIWALLGSMKELGELSEKGHLDVGIAAAQSADFVIGVGEEAKSISQTWFATAEEAADYIEEKIEAGDLLFIKGSQAARMEKVVKKLMKNPEQADELLVRQGKGWEN